MFISGMSNKIEEPFVILHVLNKMEQGILTKRDIIARTQQMNRNVRPKMCRVPSSKNIRIDSLGRKREICISTSNEILSRKA